MAIGDNIKKCRLARDMTLEEVAKMVGISRQTMSRYENGIIGNIPSDKIERMAKAMRVSPGVIMGWEEFEQLPINVVGVPELKKVPLVGQIACGTPILAEQNIEDYIDLPHHIRADYALTCKGDSMIGAGVHDGDVVYIRKQAQVDNGQIAAVMVDCEDATLKRFYYDGKSTVTLTAENPAVPPMVFAGEDVERIRVIGLAVAFSHSLV